MILKGTVMYVVSQVRERSMIFNTSMAIMKKVKPRIYMKVNTYLIGAFLAMFFLLSFSSDKYVTVPKDDSWCWGYLKGESNGEKTSLVNSESLRPIGSMETSGCYSEVPDSIRGLQTGINYSDKEYLSVTFHHLNKGVFYRSDNPSGSIIIKNIYVTRISKKQTYY